MANHDQQLFELTDRHFYINNCLGSFFKGVLNWFGDVFYPRIQYKVIGTYEKSVEYFNKKLETGYEIDTPILPAITLDPDLNFRPAELGGRFLWQSESLAPGLGKKLFNKIEGLENQDISLVPVFSRYEGEFQMTFWLNSIYEYFDIRLFLFQWSSGYNRRLRPRGFESFIILPDSINNYGVQEGIPIDWSQTDRDIMMVNNIAQNSYVLPVLLTPQFWFTDISDGSTKFGGDTIAEYKLVVNCGFEIDLPTYMVLTPYTGDIKIKLQVQMGNVYSRYGSMPFFNESTGSYEKTQGHNVSGHILSNTPNYDSTLEFKDPIERSYYTYTQADEQAWDAGTKTLIINDPYDATVPNDFIKAVSYVGIMNYGDQWKRVDINGERKIEIYIEPKQSEIVEFFRYQSEV